MLINKKAQVAIFVIVSLVIVGIIVLFFVFRSSLFGEKISPEFAPIYERYIQCINEETQNGVRLLESQGGRINVGDVLPGNDYNPFSSHLFFLGVPIPYWYGVSGNNLAIENVPRKADMEKDIGDFVAERLNDCDFSSFYAKGFFIEKNKPKVDVRISDSQISVNVDASLVTSIEDRSARRSTHQAIVSSKLGSLYNAAVDVYSAEKTSLFLENYALDVLQSYAPVDGVEVQCAPKIWKTPDVVKEIKTALAANIGAVRFAGQFSTEKSPQDKYFTVHSATINEPVHLSYLPEQFPSKIEVTPASQALMVAEPVGTQEGLGVMGFCYVPYHFVYDLSFPVLVQIGDGLETFSFPMVTIIDNNLPRVANLTDLVENESADVCSFAEGDVTVQTYDSKLNPVSADITYNCFDSFCGLGKTKLSGDNAVLNAKIPVCVGGQMIARADGYADSKITFSSNSQPLAELILEKEFPVNVTLRMGGQIVNNLTAVVHFTGEKDYSASAILPDSGTVKLKEGLYDISVFVYGNSNVIIPATRKTECFKVSRGGVAGFFGSTKEECVDVEIPAVNIDYALRGGGKTTSYVLESELTSGKVTLDVSELPKPTSLEQLQYNYEVFDKLGVQLEFK